MLFKAYLSRENAILRGINMEGRIEIDIDPSTLTPEQRELLAEYYDDSRMLFVQTPDWDGVFGALEKRREKELLEKREKAERREALVQSALNADIRDCVRIEKHTSANIEIWILNELGEEGWCKFPDDPRLREKWSKLAVEVELHNAEARKAIQEHQTQQKIETLRKRCDDLESRLETVSLVLSHVPDDAIVGAMRRCLVDDNDKRVAEFMEKVNEASTHILFENDEDSESD